MRSSSILRHHGFSDRPRDYLVHPQRKSETRLFYSEDGRLRELNELALSLYIMERQYPDEDILRIEVRDVEAWNGVRDIIENLVSFLTDRYLQVDFRKSSKPISVQTTLTGHQLVADTKPDAVCLFSGGMDSTAGVLHIRRTRVPLLHHTVTGKVVKGRALRLHRRSELSKYGLVCSDSQVRNVRPGRSLLRGFLFLTNASTIASCLGIDEVVVSENGPLMINPPVSSLSPGMTRNAHPFLVESFEEIARNIMEKKFSVECIFKNKTKAEIYAKVMDKPNLVNHTYSCFTVQGQSKMCGICYACYVRRVSALCVDFAEPADLYQMDPFRVDIGNLGSRSSQKINILHDCFLFFRNVLSDDAFVDGLLVDVPGAFFEDAQDLLRRFASDLFLGTLIALKQRSASSMNALGRFALKFIRKEIDTQVLDQRRDQLQKEKESSSKVGSQV